MISHKPSKQRKYLFTLAIHKRRSLLTAPLIKSVSERLKIKRIPIRKNDEVTIYKGDYKGVKGLVTRVDRKRGKIFIEGVTREKSDGTVVPIPMSPYNVVISKVDTSDKRRPASRGE
ncbi:MAG TPA: 50S ribosomal protein L24 [Thermoproteota archaeon]|nr:50S ribosomal protein L24 [Thermoproteota archaeon]